MVTRGGSTVQAVRVLIDLLHPAHVHFFRGFREEMLERGHQVLVTARDKDVTTRLLDELAIPHRLLSKQKTGLLGLGVELVSRTRRLWQVVRGFRPDVLTGIMGASIAPLGRLTRIPAVVFYDTEIARLTNSWVYPLAKTVCTPDSYQGKVRGRHVTYAGYHELAYLHPDRFSPDQSRLESYGLSPPYTILRVVSWDASHDLGDAGLSGDQMTAIVDRLLEHGRVAISAEGSLPQHLEPYRISGPASDLHHAMAFADVFVSESRTMASEAALLGTPSILLIRRTAGVIDDHERYGVLRRFEPDDPAALEAIDDALSTGDEGALPQALLRDKIDVTEWMVDFFEARTWDRRSRTPR